MNLFSNQHRIPSHKLSSNVFLSLLPTGSFRCFPFLLVPTLVLSIGLLGAIAQPALTYIPAPVQLSCENQIDPIVIDTTSPGLSWKLPSAQRGFAQSAYEIEVASSRELLDQDQADLWKSREIKSDQSIHVIYQGVPLKSRSTCFWRVRILDEQGRLSPWSQTASFTVGILSNSEWQAGWIAFPDGATSAPTLKGSWIWGPDTSPKSRYFLRKTFELPEGFDSTKATLTVSVDNRFTAFINAERVSRGNEWRTPNQVEIGQFLVTGKNVVALRVSNEDFGAGALAIVSVKLADGQTLEITTDETWKISSEDPDGWDTPEFDDSTWSQALVQAAYGQGAWGNLDVFTPRRSQMARCDFDLSGQVLQARAYVTGLGFYTMTMNGKPVSDAAMTPGWTDFNKKIPYQVYDVTDLVSNGSNTVGMILGSGWWSALMMGMAAPMYQTGPMRAICEIHVDLADGSHQVILSDPEWKYTRSPIMSDSIYHGETWNAMNEQAGWDQPAFDDSAWQNAQPLTWKAPPLIIQPCELMKPIEEVKPITMKEVASGVFVYDLGQNMVGWARLKVQGPTGTQVSLRFAEVLQEDGNIYTANLRGAKANDFYILAGRPEGEVWEPRFTYHGYRYIELTGFPGTPTLDTLTGVVVHTDVARIGQFDCSNELINRITKNIDWGLRGNFHAVPTDCPQRDERLGWTGDAEDIVSTAAIFRDISRYFAKFEQDLADTQHPDNGFVTDVAPLTPGINYPASPAWGDALTIIPWVLYQEYGDPRILDANLQAMARWVDFMTANSHEFLYEPKHNYGDWIAVVNTPKEQIGTAFYYYSTWIVARAAEILGRTDLQVRYDELADNIAKAFQAHYFDPATGQYQGGTQTANLLPLMFGITPPELRPRVIENIVADIRKRDIHLSTGFIGTGYLLPILSEYGQGDLAWQLAVQTTYPSWGYMVEKDATTIWELWNSDTTGPGMNSRNHYALGAVGKWYFSYLAGINTELSGPGYHHIRISPYPAPGLEWARASIETPYGQVSSSWKQEDHFLLETTLPSNTSGVVELPVADIQTARILEGDQIIFADGKPAKSADGISWQESLDGKVRFKVTSGTYKFKVEKADSRK